MNIIMINLLNNKYLVTIAHSGHEKTRYLGYMVENIAYEKIADYILVIILDTS